MSAMRDLVTQLVAPGDSLHLTAAEALVNLHSIAERLQERVYQLEAIARLNLETIQNRQRAQAARDQYSGADR